MSNVNITPMTAELAHCLYGNEYERDIITYNDKSLFKPFVYSKEWVDEYLLKQENLHHILFAIMLDNTTIGEVKLHNISLKRKTCEVGIHLKNDAYKNKGYGTEALRQVMQYAKDTLKMEFMQARTIVKNVPSQRLFKKLDFKEVFREFKDIYFEKELNRVEVIKPIRLIKMTKELYRQFLKGSVTDLPPRGHRQNYRPYVYSDDDTADTNYRLQTMLGRHMFAIMIDGAPVGEIKLLGFDYDKGSCQIEVGMQSMEYKNRGYGKKAIIRVLQYAKEDLGLKKVCAIVDAENTHAQHVFEKIGFIIKEKTSRYLHYKHIKYEFLL